MGVRHQTHVITQPPSFATSDEGLYCIFSPFLLILILLVFCLPHKSVFCVLHWSLLNCEPWTRSTTQFLDTEIFFYLGFQPACYCDNEVSELPAPAPNQKELSWAVSREEINSGSSNLSKFRCVSGNAETGPRQPPFLELPICCFFILGTEDSPFECAFLRLALVNALSWG